MNLTFLKELNRSELIQTLEPGDIQQLCEFSAEANEFITDLFENDSLFRVVCKTYIPQHIVDWFELRKFKLDLLIEIKHDKKTCTTQYFKNGKLHRDDDLPAVINVLIDRYEWYQNGKRHRNNDQPAIIDNYCTEWYHERHRDNDKPAVICNNCKKWYWCGKLHRDNDQPAIFNPRQHKEWYIHGKRHCEGDRPAVIVKNQFMKWYLNDELHRYAMTKPSIIFFFNRDPEWYTHGKKRTKYEM
jgi:hypothetical protein